MSTKGCAGFFILFRSWVIYRNVKNKGVETRFFSIFANNSRSKQNKNPAHPFHDIGKWETCTKFQQKILNCRVVWALQSFQIVRQNTWLLKNNRPLSKFLYGILHYLISIIKLWQSQPKKKKQFYFNHASHLNDTLNKKLYISE